MFETKIEAEAPCKTSRLSHALHATLNLFPRFLHTLQERVAFPVSTNVDTKHILV